jgi:hypothetical protein
LQRYDALLTLVQPIPARAGPRFGAQLHNNISILDVVSDGPNSGLLDKPFYCAAVLPL